MTLHRLGSSDTGASGRLSNAWNLYQSEETVVLLADPRASESYTPAGSSDVPASELVQCRNCERPDFVTGPVVELLAGGRWVRARLAVDLASPGDVQAATQTALDLFESAGASYPAPAAIAEMAAWADDIPSPIQVSLAEPAKSPAVWSPGEAGTALSLVSGDALLSTSDFSWQGRKLTLALDRTYRSGTLGFGPLGAAGWHGSLFAHLREIPTTGEVELHDGEGNVFRFIPRSAGTLGGFVDDPAGSYQVPSGLDMRLVKLGDGLGWRLFDRHHNFVTFDSEGRLLERSDRLRQGKPAGTQGNTLTFSHDAFGRLVSIEDDLGRSYRLAYYDDPRPESSGGDGPRYGLLKRVTDFAGRKVDYQWDDQRRLTAVSLPEVSNPLSEYHLGYSYTGDDRPKVTYTYDPAAGVSHQDGTTTAVLHGAFAPLRLEGFTQPGSGVLRARFEYDETTGRAKALAFPDSYDQNSAGMGVTWTVSFPNQAGSAAPATKAIVSAPWSHDTEYTIANGRTTAVGGTVEALGASDPTPGLHGTIPTKTLTTELDYDGDGRITKVTQANGSETDYTYPTEGDLLARSNVLKATAKAGLASIGTASYSEISRTLTPAFDNLVGTYTDGEDRQITVPLAMGGGGEVTAGYQAENVLTTTTFDPFGRVTQATTTGTTPVVTEMSFATDHNGTAGAGLLNTVTSGGSTTTLSYDDRDNVKESTTSYGTSASFVHDDWDRIVSSISGKSKGSLAAVNAKSERAFDAAGRLVRERRWQTGVGWVETSYSYNARGQVTSVTESGLAPPTPGGGLVNATTTYGYDVYGRLATTTSPAGVVTTNTYDSTSRVVSTQVSGSGTHRVAYDELGHVAFSTDGDDGVWRGRYDAWGRLYSEQPPASAFLERAFDRSGALTRATAFEDASKATTLAETTFTTTSFGAVSESRELVSGGGSPSTALVTTRTFDGAGRTVDVKRGPTGSLRLEQHLTYEPGTGRTLTVTDAVGNETRFVHAGATPWPRSIVTTEPAAGAQSAITTTTALTYDAFGRVVHEDLGGTLIDRSFDESGNLLATSTGGIDRVTSTFDGYGLLLTTGRPDVGQRVDHGYDTDGRLLVRAVLRESGATEATTFHYDATGRLDTRTRPGSLPESFTYNGDDTLKTWTTRLASTSGQQLVLSLGYDQANRVTFRGPANPEAFEGGSLPVGLAPVDGGDVIAYDPLGRVSSIGTLRQPGDTTPDPSSVVTYAEYDTRGLPRTERVGSWPADSAVERHYDAFGNTTSTILPPGVAGSTGLAAYAVTYDDLDRMTSVTAAQADGTPIPGSAFGATLGWSGAGRPVSVTTPGGLATSRVFDTVNGRLATLGVSAGGTDLGSLQYGWDVTRNLKLGRQVAPTGVGLTSGLGYGARYDVARRTSSTQTGRGTLAGGDTQGTPFGSWGFSYGKADELLATTDGSAGVATYASGVEGRVETRTDAAGSETFAYRLHRAAGRGRLPPLHLGLARQNGGRRAHQRRPGRRAGQLRVRCHGQAHLSHRVG